MLAAQATANFRKVQRPEGLVLQQMYLITEGAGSVKERSYYAWLDFDHAMFEGQETELEAKQRKAVEAAGIIRRP